MITDIHLNMKRRLVASDGSLGNYLDGSHSALLEGTSWQQQQVCGAGTSGLIVTGSFTTPQVGTYVENVTQGFIAQILVTSAGQLDMHYPLQTTGANWGVTDGATTAGKLIDSTASFTTTATVGMIVSLRNLSDYAVVTAVDSDTQLSVSKDIFPSGTDYNMMKGFVEGDTIRLGTAVLDGSAGHVMVEIPRFYYGYSYSAGVHSWSISPASQDGMEPFMAFVKPDASLHNALYVSAFEGAITGRSQGSAAAINPFFDPAVDMLNSYAGFQPVSNGTRAEFRQMAENNGTGWQIIDWYSHFACQLLFFIEYEDMHSQQSLGDGVVNWSSILDYNNDSGLYAPSHNGFSIPEGNASGELSTADYVGGYLSYRGIENFWGNLGKWVDGINIIDGQVYLANDPAGYQDDITTSPYFDTGVIEPYSDAVNRFISKVHPTKHGFLVAEKFGSDSTYIPDYAGLSSGMRVSAIASYCNSGSSSGFAWRSSNFFSDHIRTDKGSRLCIKL